MSLASMDMEHWSKIGKRYNNLLSAQLNTNLSN